MTHSNSPFWKHSAAATAATNNPANNPANNIPANNIPATNNNPASLSIHTHSFKPSHSHAAPRRKRYYAVRKGRDGFVGVLESWEECQKVVHSVSGAHYKAFNDLNAARIFIRDSPPHPTPSSKKPNKPTNKPPNEPTNKPNNSRYPLRSSASNKNNTKTSASASASNASSHTNHQPPNDHLLIASSAAALAADAPNPSDESPAHLTVYTDGACIHNGKPNARAGYGVFFHIDSPYNVSEPLKVNPTNQTAELMAVLVALRVTLDHGLVAKNGTLQVCTDSQYVVNGITLWMVRWAQNHWKTAAGSQVKNKELWVALDACKAALSLKTVTVNITWVKGHNGIFGNEQADRLAVNGIHQS